LAIITTTEYKTYAGISGSTYDAQLDVLIPALQDELERLTGRLFDTGTYTEYVDGSDSPTVSVNNYPVTSVTSVQLIDRAETVQYTYEATGYKIEASSGLISRQTGGMWGTGGCDSWWAPLPYPMTFNRAPVFPDGWRNIKIVYVGGYASNAMPAALKKLMYDATATAFAQIGVDLSMKSETLGHYKYDRGTVGGAVGNVWALFGERVQLWKRVST